MSEATVRRIRSQQQAGDVSPAPTPTIVAQAETVEVTEGVIAIDNGGFNTKILSEDMDVPVVIYSRKGFGSDLGIWANFNIPNDGQSYAIKIGEDYFFTGILIEQADGELNGFVDNKDDDFFIVSALLGTALYGFDINYLVTCAPISRFKQTEIDAIRNRLLGKHQIEINNGLYEFEIRDVIVAPETYTASGFDKPEELTRWLDLGSRTVGFATTMYRDGQAIPVPKASGTIEKEGLNIKKVKSWKTYVTNLTKELNRYWDREDKVVAFGGGALIPELIAELQKYYPNITVAEDPLFLQVKGMLEMGLDQFGTEEDADE